MNLKIKIKNLTGILLCICISVNLLTAGNYVVNSDSTYNGYLYTDSMTINNAELHYKGTLNATDNNTNFNFLLNNSAILFHKETRIDNNQYDQVNARTIFFVGNNRNKDSVIFEEGFVADHTNYDTSKTFEENDNGTDWDSDGFSSMRLKNATFITKHTQSHPSIYKKTLYGDLTHHGLIGFMGKCKWIIRKNDQWNDCQVTWDSNFTIETQKDLLFKGKYHSGAAVYFGNGNHTEGPPISKKGKGDLILSGSQWYSSGTIMHIEEGNVIFKWNPAYRHQSKYTKRIGLNIDIQKNTMSKVDHIRADVESIISDGDLILDSSKVVTTKNITFKSNSNLILRKEYKNYSLVSDDSVFIDGKISFDFPDTKDTIKICKANNGIKGQFSSSPNGYNIIYKSNKVYATKKSTSGAKNQNINNRNIKFINYTANPFIIAKHSLHKMNISLFTLNGKKINNKSVSAGKNEKLHLKKLFQNIPENELLILKIRLKDNFYSYKCIVH